MAGWCRANMQPLFLPRRHALAQHLIDARLPALPLLPVGLKDIVVEAQRLVDLFVNLGGPAPARPEQRLRGGVANQSGQHLGRGASPAQLRAREWWVIVIRAF